MPQNQTIKLNQIDIYFEYEINKQAMVIQNLTAEEYTNFIKQLSTDLEV